ncbi:MAG TPA: hypothetical protein VMS31_07465 [Pyrinomonadaceae bacterium]|nr:hypothetical protein [Pyrinomonadaceae bacterium]
MKKISLIVYGIYGSVAILSGTAALLFPNALEPDGPADLIHVFREAGAALVFVGLMSFWLLFHYDQRKPVHLFLTVFSFLIAAIHWFDFLGGRRPLTSAVINSLGFVVFLALVIFAPRAKTIARGVSC